MSESAKKGKITLSGLTKGSSITMAGTSFPSFRFSPENEEIEEIMLQDPTADDKAQSLPESPKPSSSNGDVSPLKEMLKHKWANKWEKRSLSLDLDLKGKIITAIEDKRKSIFSQFITEETGIIPSSGSIAEHIGYTGDADMAVGHHGKYSHSHDCLESCAESQGEVEEVGTDYLAHSLLAEDNHLDHLLKFSVAPELLQEYFAGYSPLYYRYPRFHAELPNHESVVEIQKDDLKPSTIFNRIVDALSSHKWTKYFVGIAAVALFLPTLVAPLVWMVVGGMAVIIFQDSLLNRHPIADSPAESTELPSAECDNGGTPSFSSASLSPSSSQPELKLMHSISSEKKIQRYGSRSQGWMTEFEGDYDPFSCHVRLTRIVFVRLDGCMLSVSYPHPKHRIPKRPLWNDPPIPSEVIFVRHNIYNISGATVSIAPEKLARNRAWNKKYPIAIRLPNQSVVATICPSAASDVLIEGKDSAEESNPTTSSTNSGIKITEADKKSSEVKKEVTREDCSFKILWLFSRTDREKDDWFRRLQAASKLGPNVGESSELKSEQSFEQETLQHYLDYMRKVIPSLSEDLLEKAGSLMGSKQDGKEAGNEKDSGKKDTSDNGSSSSKLEDTPTSSRKGSPALDDSMSLEILTVPHSPVFLNAFLGRLFYDFLRSPHWTGKISGLIQKKLNFIRRPQFLETLLVRDLDLGSAMPLIQRASSPSVDSQGLWLDLDLTYEGNLVLTLETKINLLKLRKSPSQETEDHGAQNMSTVSSSVSYNGSSGGFPTVSVTDNSSGGTLTKKSSQDTSGVSGQTQNCGGSCGDAAVSKSSSTMTINRSNSSTPVQAVAHMFDSDADDSGESSEDDTNPDDFLAHQGSESASKDDPQNPGDSNSASSKGKKILKMAEKIASSKYVQQATEMKVVKKAIANVANTPIVLSVELKSLAGTLVLNIPPPPTDRLWMGFRHNPSMQISARPKFGSRAVNLTQVTDWIQKKLLHEFQRVVVFPNMNDVTIPLMEFKIPK